MHRLLVFAFAFAVVVPAALAGVTVELVGSRASMERQNRVALESGLTFARTFADIDRMVASGVLVELHGDDNYEVLEGIRSNAARPEVQTFVERLAAEYHEATGEKLVVTSLTRPSSSQPPNASPLSVHPAGISVDLRVSQRAESRAWIEARLLQMERDGLLDVTREHRPPHYHVAIFPEAYMTYVDRQVLIEAMTQEPEEEREVLILAAAVVPDVEDEEPRRRTFWTRIASFFGLA
jgi:hypothetical protein